MHAVLHHFCPVTIPMCNNHGKYSAEFDLQIQRHCLGGLREQRYHTNSQGNCSRHLDYRFGEGKDISYSQRGTICANSVDVLSYLIAQGADVKTLGQRAYWAPLRKSSRYSSREAGKVRTQFSYVIRYMCYVSTYKYSLKLATATSHTPDRFPANHAIPHKPSGSRYLTYGRLIPYVQSTRATE